MGHSGVVGVDSRTVAIGLLAVLAAVVLGAISGTEAKTRKAYEVGRVETGDSQVVLGAIAVSGTLGNPLYHGSGLIRGPGVKGQPVGDSGIADDLERGVDVVQVNSRSLTLAPRQRRLGWPGTGLWRLPTGLERLGRTREGHA
jgi:hypothetical protein